MVNANYRSIRCGRIEWMIGMPINDDLMERELKENVKGYVKLNDTVYPVVQIKVEYGEEGKRYLPTYNKQLKKFVAYRSKGQRPKKSDVFSAIFIGKSAAETDEPDSSMYVFSMVSDAKQCSKTEVGASHIVMSASEFEQYPEVYEVKKSENSFTVKIHFFVERSFYSNDTYPCLKPYNYIQQELYNGLFEKETDRYVITFLNDGVEEYYAADFEAEGTNPLWRVIEFKKIPFENCYQEKKFEKK